MDEMKFSAQGPAGLGTVQQSGNVVFNEKRRVLRRNSVSVSGGSVFTTGLFGGGKRAGVMGAVAAPQQVMTVDSMLLITRGVPNVRTRQVDDEKDYFAVWRRVEPGTYSRQKETKRATTMTG